MNRDDTPKIPDAVLSLLKERWQDSQSFSHFDSVWARDEERQARPSWYSHRKDSDHPFGKVLTFDDCKALKSLPAFSGMIYEGEDAYGVNEHLQHALQDFCSTVYDKWSELLERAETIASHQRTPDPGE